MNRLDNFQALQKHPIFIKDFKRLSKAEYNFCVEYLKATIELNDNDYAHKTNRIGIDTKLEFKNKTTIWAILSQCITVKERNHAK